MALTHAVVLAALALCGAHAQGDYNDCAAAPIVECEEELADEKRSIKLSGCITIQNDNGNLISVVPLNENFTSCEFYNDERKSAVMSLNWASGSEQFNIFLSTDNNNATYHVDQFQYIQNLNKGDENRGLYSSPKSYRGYVNGKVFCDTSLTLSAIPNETTTTTTTTTTAAPADATTPPSVKEVTLSAWSGGLLNLTSFYIEYRSSETKEVNFVSSCVVEPDITLVTSISGVVTGVLLFAAALLAVNVHCGNKTAY